MIIGDHMKRKEKIWLMITSFVLLLLILYVVYYREEKNFHLYITYETECNEEAILYMDRDYSYYTVCIQNIDIKLKGHAKMSLKDAFEQNLVSYSSLVDELEKKEETIYQGAGYYLTMCENDRVIIGSKPYKNLCYEKEN